jgi:hypothetical protein
MRCCTAADGRNESAAAAATSPGKGGGGGNLPRERRRERGHGRGRSVGDDAPGGIRLGPGPGGEITVGRKVGGEGEGEGQVLGPRASAKVGEGERRGWLGSRRLRGGGVLAAVVVGRDEVGEGGVETACEVAGEAGRQASLRGERHPAAAAAGGQGDRRGRRNPVPGDKRGLFLFRVCHCHLGPAPPLCSPLLLH